MDLKSKNSGISSILVRRPSYDLTYLLLLIRKSLARAALTQPGLRAFRLLSVASPLNHPHKQMLQNLPFGVNLERSTEATPLGSQLLAPMDCKAYWSNEDFTRPVGATVNRRM